MTHPNSLLKTQGAEQPLNTCMTLLHVLWQKRETQNVHACVRARSLGHLRGLGCLRLVCLEFLASFHLHGAVDNPIGSQRLQPLHFHDHHLGSTDITAICCSPALIHTPGTEGQSVKRQNMERTRCCQILPPFFSNLTQSMSATVAMHTPALIFSTMHSGGELSFSINI